MHWGATHQEYVPTTQHCQGRNSARSKIHVLPWKVQGGDMLSALTPRTTGLNHHVLYRCQGWPVNILPFGRPMSFPPSPVASMWTTSGMCAWSLFNGGANTRSGNSSSSGIGQRGAVLGFQDYLGSADRLKNFSHLLPLTTSIEQTTISRERKDFLTARTREKFR